jgi:hypothetical protein
LGQSRHNSELERERTQESMKTLDSGEWGAESRMGTMMGIGVPISRTTSDEEEEDGVLEVKAHKDVHVHRKGGSPLASPPITRLEEEEEEESGVNRIPHEGKVVGRTIHEGHAHAIPDNAGEIESNKPTKDLVGTTTKAGASSGAHTDEEEDDDEIQRIPGAFIWDKVKAALP